MSDVQKLKELMAKYHAVTKKKKFDDGGMVTADDLAPYMPTPDEEAQSGLPPGPQRATYIANKKYQAAHPAPSGYDNGGQVQTSPGPIFQGQQTLTPEQQKESDAIIASLKKPGYDQGGSVSDPGWTTEDKKAFSAGMAGQMPQPQSSNVSKYKMTDAEDAAEQGEEETKKQHGYDDGGEVKDDTPQATIALPNGGLDGEALQQAIAQNPGPVATTGFNPNANQDTDDNSDEEDDATTVTLPKSTIKQKNTDSNVDTSDLSNLTDDVSVSPNDNKPNIKDLLNSVASSGNQGNQNDPNRPITLADLQAAQKKDSIIGGIVGLLGGSSAQAQYLKNGATAQIQQQLEARSQNNKNTLDQLQIQDEQEQNNANSAVSQFARQYLKNQLALSPTGKNVNIPDNMSYSTIAKLFPQVTTSLDREYKTKELADSAANRNATLQLAAGSKANDKQDKALTSAQTLLESARGNPAAAQAEKDLYSAQKADSLANLYGDPNKLSLPQVKLLASEVGKIAAGGVSSQSELEGITPNTLVGKMSQYVSNLTNNPTPANAAAFVKQYQDYTGALAKDAQKVIQDKYGRIIESRKNQLGPQNYQALQDQYINRFKTPSRTPQSNSQEEMVNVVSPEGIPGTLPKSKLKAAQDRGFKVQ